MYLDRDIGAELDYCEDGALLCALYVCRSGVRLGVEDRDVLCNSKENRSRIIHARYYPVEVLTEIALLVRFGDGRSAFRVYYWLNPISMNILSHDVLGFDTRPRP